MWITTVITGGSHIRLILPSFYQSAKVKMICPFFNIFLYLKIASHFLIPSFQDNLKLILKKIKTTSKKNFHFIKVRMIMFRKCFLTNLKTNWIVNCFLTFSCQKKIWFILISVVDKVLEKKIFRINRDINWNISKYREIYN